MKLLAQYKNEKEPGNDGGYISLICLFVISLALLITLSITGLTVDELHRANRLANNSIALSVAEAGAEYTVAQLRASSTYTGTGGDVSFDDGSFKTIVTTQANGDHRITSTGSLSDGTSRTVEILLSKSGTGSIPGGAIVSNGGARLTGNSTLRTSPTNQHSAHVYANRNIQATGNASIDGNLYAGGSVSTNGNVDCMAKVNYAPLISFPTDSEIDAMDLAWKNQAIQGTIMGGISVNGNKSLTYSTPLYINGDIDLNGNINLTFTGSGVVYVNGNVKMSGNQTLTNGGILVVKGTIQQTGNSVYTATGDLGNCGLVSLSNNSTQAIQCTGNGDSTPMGLIYAPRGGIQFTGNSSVFGGIVAGSTDTQAVTCVGNGSITYPLKLQENTLLPKSLSVSAWLER